MDAVEAGCYRNEDADDENDTHHSAKCRIAQSGSGFATAGGEQLVK